MDLGNGLLVEDYIIYGLNLSRDGAYLLAAGSIIIAILTVAITVITLIFTALAIRSAARENRLSKELERDMAREKEASRWLLMAAGMGEALSTDADGHSTPKLNVQLIAAAMLSNHPNALPGTQALAKAMNALGGDPATQVSRVLTQSIKKMSVS